VGFITAASQSAKVSYNDPVSQRLYDKRDESNKKSKVFVCRDQKSVGFLGKAHKNKIRFATPAFLDPPLCSCTFVKLHLVFQSTTQRKASIFRFIQ
jgi:hypothetical protein